MSPVRYDHRVTIGAQTLPRTLLILALCLLTPSAAAGDGVRVVSFNIRYGSANDGPDAWPQRREKVVETIRDLDADVLGLQEALPSQIAYLLENLPRYAAAGVSREDGRVDGEASPILYDRTRYTLADTGTFWLSDTPDEPSNTWGAACTRICTWARFVELDSGRGFFLFNTHFDHVSQPAREKSASLISGRIAARGGEDPVVLTGDLNAGEENRAIRTLMSGHPGTRMADAFRVVAPNERAGTFTGFHTDSDGGAKKIDYVLVGPGLRVIAAGIDRRKIGGRYPSDHFPVWAEFGTE